MMIDDSFVEKNDTGLSHMNDIDSDNSKDSLVIEAD